MKALLPYALALLPFTVAAQSPASIDAPPPPPLDSGEALDPEVTITEREDRIVYEYSVGGRVYMIKVVPRQGPPYYFLDRDGDGEIDEQRYGPEETSVPQWVLFRF
jgi:hypothetical protein